MSPPSSRRALLAIPSRIASATDPTVPMAATPSIKAPRNTRKRATDPRISRRAKRQARLQPDNRRQLQTEDPLCTVIMRRHQTRSAVIRPSRPMVEQWPQRSASEDHVSQGPAAPAASIASNRVAIPFRWSRRPDCRSARQPAESAVAGRWHGDMPRCCRHLTVDLADGVIRCPSPTDSERRQRWTVHPPARPVPVARLHFVWLRRDSRTPEIRCQRDDAVPPAYLHACA